VVEREIDGLRRSRLGLLYRPKYFYKGVAMHGYTSVPSHPASHGCVRLTYPAMDLVWAETLAPIGTPVLVY
jgi:lipoprotein-anchoring transpeptidase ErfK/SrfK